MQNQNKFRYLQNQNTHLNIYTMATETTSNVVLTYKGVNILNLNGYYKFILFGRQYTNTNLDMAKRMITRELKLYSTK